jgi:hypothetical protein
MMYGKSIYTDEDLYRLKAVWRLCQGAIGSSMRL